MSIQIITGFTVNSSTPLDNRIVASGAAARNSIPYKYVGLRVFDTSNNRAYYYNGVTSDDRLVIEEILTEIFTNFYYDICPSKDYSILPLKYSKSIAPSKELIDAV